MLSLCLDQFLVGEPVLSDQRQQRVPEEERVVAIVEPESEFVQVGVQMFGGELVVGADQGSLEEREHALDAVCVNVRPHPLIGSVLNGFVAALVVADSPVTAVLVRVDASASWATLSLRS